MKKTNYVRHIQRVCTVCAVIPEFYGSQEHIFACGGMFGGWRQGIYFLLMIFWNYLYIIFQDLWTFPQTFFNYREYQKTTPVFNAE